MPTRWQPLTVLVGASLSSNADGFVALHVSDAVACKVQRKAALTLTLTLTLALALALTLTLTLTLTSIIP